MPSEAGQLPPRKAALPPQISRGVLMCSSCALRNAVSLRDASGDARRRCRQGAGRHLEHADPGRSPPVTPRGHAVLPHLKTEKWTNRERKRFQLAGPRSCLLAKTQPQPEKDVTGRVEVETSAADRTLSPLFCCVPCFCDCRSGGCSTRWRTLRCTAR